MKVKVIAVLLSFIVISVFGQTEIFSLAKVGMPKQVEEAVLAGARINDRSVDTGMTPLMIAARNNKYPAVITALIKAGANLDDRDELDAATPLMIAAGWNANPDVVLALLDAGAKIDDRDKFNNKTALMFAAMYNTNPEVVFALLNAGADGRLKSFKGLTAWDYADRNPALKGTQAWLDLDQARK